MMIEHYTLQAGGDDSLVAAGQALDESSFDFWVGNWKTRWKDAGGRIRRGTNVVLKLDQRIREAA